MGRPAIRPGQHGEITVIALEKGFQARTRYRPLHGGRPKLVSANGATKGAARRALLSKLSVPQVTGSLEIRPSMTMGELADVWLAHRQKHGKARSAGPLRQQSLAAYNATVRHQIKPLMGEVQLREITVSYLDGTLARLESGEGTGKKGRSSAQIRSVLGQMFGLAIRHGALVSNPMDLVATTSRPRMRAGGVDVLEAADLHRLLHVVDREVRRVPGRVRPSFLLQDVVATLIGTGARDGEVLALRWCDVDLESDVPTVRVRGTLVESRKGYVEKTYRQDETKTASERLLVIPQDLVEVLKARQKRIAQPVDPEAPVFATGRGGWPEPSNIRTGLRVATKDVAGLAGTSPHVIRRSVATHLELTCGLDAARRQMGHSDPSVTYQRYVVRSAVMVDNRTALRALFTRDGEVETGQVETGGVEAGEVDTGEVSVDEDEQVRRGPA